MLLPVIWTLFALAAVGGFLMIAAYWLDLRDRSDLSRSARFRWLAGMLVFPVAIPIYAFTGGAGWPPFLRAASLIPIIALALFFGFLVGVFA